MPGLVQCAIALNDLVVDPVSGIIRPRGARSDDPSKRLIEARLQPPLANNTLQPPRNMERAKWYDTPGAGRVPAETPTNSHREIPRPVGIEQRVDGDHVGSVLSCVSYDPTQGSIHTSEAVTSGVRVHVTACYAPSRSDPLHNLWFFLYTIEITNERSDAVQLISRHWIITDADSNLEEVRGLGVVGQQPTLEPGESFEYTSGCPLKTPFGTMHGTYELVTPDGDQLEVEVAPFTLSEPYTIH